VFLQKLPNTLWLSHNGDMRAGAVPLPFSIWRNANTSTACPWRCSEMDDPDSDVVSVGWVGRGASTAWASTLNFSFEFISAVLYSMMLGFLSTKRDVRYVRTMPNRVDNIGPIVGAGSDCDGRRCPRDDRDRDRDDRGRSAAGVGLR
jgi:hypothetical protein